MDIVVTIPKSEYKNDDQETIDIQKKGYNAFWTFKRGFPKELKKGDRIYFVKNGQIDSSMRVKGFNTESQQCLTTNRTWSGFTVMMDDLKDERKLGIEAKGFQGYRYRWW